MNSPTDSKGKVAVINEEGASHGIERNSTASRTRRAERVGPSARFVCFPDQCILGCIRTRTLSDVFRSTLASLKRCAEFRATVEPRGVSDVPRL
jgi:hypothetical protein